MWWPIRDLHGISQRAWRERISLQKLQKRVRVAVGRSDAKLATISGRFDALSIQLSQVSTALAEQRAEALVSRAEQRAEQSANRTAIIVTTIATGLAVAGAVVAMLSYGTSAFYNGTVMRDAIRAEFGAAPTPRAKAESSLPAK